MRKTILVGISALVLAFTTVVKADMSISGYQEFFVGSEEGGGFAAKISLLLARRSLDIGEVERLFFCS